MVVCLYRLCDPQRLRGDPPLLQSCLPRSCGVLDTGPVNILLWYIKFFRLPWLGRVACLRPSSTIPWLMSSPVQSERSHLNVNKWCGSMEWENMQWTWVKWVSHILVVGIRSNRQSVSTKYWMVRRRTVNSRDRFVTLCLIGMIEKCALYS